MPAAHRTLMPTKAANVQSYKPHAMKETYYWRCITGGQLLDHCERVIGVLNPSDTNPFHSVLHGFRAAIRKNLHKRALNEGQLLTRQMIDRGIAAQAMYRDFLQELSHLSHLYSPPLAEDFSPRSPSRTQPGTQGSASQLLPLTDGPGTLSHPWAMSSVLDLHTAQLLTPLLTLTTDQETSTNTP